MTKAAKPDATLSAAKRGCVQTRKGTAVVAEEHYVASRTGKSLDGRQPDTEKLADQNLGVCEEPQWLPGSQDVLTPEECASWLKVSRRQLQRVGIPHIRVSHRVRRYRKPDVLRWLDSQVSTHEEAA